jgi:16S rRNA (cytidine1402-2'-O)-methyltransferase
MTGTLYIVSTPIGNLDDITLRALKVLKSVDIIAVEDTRHSAKLLSHFGISKQLISYWGEREKVQSDKVLALLRQGRDVALISDAGTPGISDPGEVLIRKVIEASVSVVPIPGPSAILAALAVSGLSTREFTFLGFIPAKKNERKKFFREIAFERRTLVLYESPHRLRESLDDLIEVMPERNIAVCHELTKIHESIFRGTVRHVAAALENAVIAGEYVIMIEGAQKGNISVDEALREVEKLMKAGKGRKDAVSIVSKDYGISRKELYDLSLGKK